MERLDKVIASQGKYSRKDVKKLASSKRILVNDKIANKTDIKVDIDKDVIKIDGEKLNIKKYLYLVLNKPKGYVSATRDNKDKTVLELVPDELYNKDLFPAGRLDKDTTGLMIITNDGMFAHDILSPRKHVDKTYLVTIDIETTQDMVKGFLEGVKLNDGICKSSKMEIVDSHKAIVTLSEGRYHQIKRMFGCFGAKVVDLHRLSMGCLELPKDLKPGECRELTSEEIDLIKLRK